MKLFDAVIKSKRVNTDGTLSVECLHAAYKQMVAEVDSFSYLPTDPNFDTMEKIAKHIIDTYTNLPSHMISLKDELGVAIPSTGLEWSKTIVIDILVDIAKKTNSYLFLNEYLIPEMNTYINADFSPISIERGKNLSSNNIIKDTNMRTNSVSAFVNYQANNTLFAKRDSRLEYNFGFGATFNKYIASSFLISRGATEINKYYVYFYELNNAGASFECRLLYNSSNQDNIAPDYGDAGSILANSTQLVAQAAIPNFPSWIEITISPAVDVSTLGGKKVWFAIKKVGTDTSNMYRVYHAAGGEYMNTESNGNFNSGAPAIYSNSSAIKLLGNIAIFASGSSSDIQSISDKGLFHKNLVSKSARDDNACEKFSENVVSFFKDGLYLGDATIPFERVFPGKKIVVYDPLNNLYYENLFVKKTNFINSRLTIEVSESEIEIVEDTEHTGKDIKQSDSMLLG